MINDTSSIPVHQHSRFAYILAYLLFNPDPTVVWARRVARHPLVLAHAKEVSFVLSSSPPESVHVASSALAQRLQADLIIDMRYGWLDEPLKPLLKYFHFQRWREGQLETRILHTAKHIFVTSEIWKEMLERRLAFTRGKVTVLTNGYPPDSLQIDNVKPARSTSGRLALFYAGRFSGSRSTQSVKLLLVPLLSGAETFRAKGGIILQGRLESLDLQEVAELKSRFESKGWTLEVRSPVHREEMLRQLREMDGLLLLSASCAAIPSKLFEYLTARRPILAVAPKNSAVWRLLDPLPQVFLLDYVQTSNVRDIVHAFLEACSAEPYACDVPTEFTEEHLCRVFLGSLGYE
jgi:glycosyltransferase involved in cell wall biosynthesis